MNIENGTLYRGAETPDPADIGPQSVFKISVLDMAEVMATVAAHHRGIEKEQAAAWAAANKHWYYLAAKKVCIAYARK